MVYRKRRQPRVRRMAIFADYAGLDVCRIFARCVRPIVTARAVSGDIYVIEIGGQPPGCRVTIFAIISARDMRRVLASRSGAVMAGSAGAYHLCVIYRVNGRPDIRVVAVLTDFR